MRPQRRMVSSRHCQKTAADIVNSDAVSERSAKRSRRALWRHQERAAWQRYSARGEQSAAQNSTASWRENISVVGRNYATSFRMRAMKFSRDLRLKFKRGAPG